MRSIGFVALCLGLSLIAGVSLATSEEIDEICIPMKTLVLEPLSGAKQHRSSVDFPHSTHFNFACQRCHHDWNGQTEVQTCMTSGCHDQLKTPSAVELKSISGAAEIKYFKKAYHQLCLGCHREMKQKNAELELSKKVIKSKLPDVGPTACADCHPKQKK